jgi:primosomal protein N' (replication factor Y) (superfamily II helicase)
VPKPLPDLLPESAVPVADVVFGARTGGTEARFTYLLPFAAVPGDLVLAPLSGRPLVGVVNRVYESNGQELGFPLDKLKPLESKIAAGPKSPSLRVPVPVLEMARFVEREYLVPLPVAVGPALPPGLADRLSHVWTLDPDALASTALALTPLQAELVRAAEEKGGALSPPKSLPAGQRRALRLLEAKGIFVRTSRLADVEEAVPGRLYRLTPDPERIEAFLHEHGKKRPAQTLILLKLREGGEGALSMEDIRTLGGVTQGAVKALLESGLLEPVEGDGGLPAAAPTPNSEQRLAIEALTSAIAGKRARGFLLFGVTGSGKTEVFLRAAAEALRAGRQVLYLVPEIALATQAIGLLRERFGGRVAVLHSELTPRDRLANWIRIARGECPLVIGARSALFAPLGNLGLIVVDEEHEASYKQEASPRYHARTLAKYLAQRHGCPFVLGSATPSVESFQETLVGGLELLELTRRTAQARLPEVEIEDLGAGFRAGQPALLTDRLAELLEETVARGEQAILFLNRRAYAPFLVCRECGRFFMCPRCAVTLTYSRKSALLRCHHCGHQETPPEVCPGCQGSRLSPVGVGTEKVEEAVQALLPEASIARLDRDVAARKGELERILASFGAGEIQVLVGTQIVAKGLNFPNVTLVGVVAADVSLNLPDFRASERTFQLLSQVAGRAGRGESPGRVVFQTFNPSHPAIQAARLHDYRGFFEEVVQEREEAGYPPFRKLVNVVFSGTEYAPVVRAAEEAVRRLRTRLESRLAEASVQAGAHAPSPTPPSAGAPANGPEVLGPSQCVLERLQNRWRWHLLVKLLPGADLAPVSEALEGLDSPQVQVTVDVDPYSLM